eukprot:GEMP01017848.1.p1 GENE.GEMP01017848.1~~GEMP01017848.1.p1  ORF type:complete len:456 (+),score=47.64 GEMP01017848.1:31-1398(+)
MASVTINTASESEGMSSISLTAEDLAPSPHRFRWYLIVLQAFYSFASSVTIMCFLPIATDVARDMRVGISSIIILESSTWFLAALSKVPAAWYAERKGPLPNLLVAGVTIVVGSLIRVVPHSFPFLCIGTITCQIGQAFVQVLPAMITELYFPDGEKALSTSIGVAAEYFGAGVGMFVGSFFLNGSLTGLWYFTGVLPLCGVPLFLFVWWNVENRNTIKNISIYTAAKDLFGNSLFCLSFCSLGITFGMFNVLLSNISLMAPPSMKEYTGVYALVLFSSGMVGAAIIGHLVDRFNVEIYLAVRACGTFGFILLFIQCFFWIYDCKWGVLITAALIGFVGPSLPSLIIRHLIESINCEGIESVMNSLLLISYAIVASILIPVCNPHVLHLEGSNNVYTIWVLLVATLPGFVLVFFLRGPVDKPNRGREAVQMVESNISTTNLLTSTSPESSDPDLP